MSTTTTHTKSKKSYLFIATTVLLAITNTLLLMQNLRLKGIINQASQRVEVQPGDVVGALHGQGLSGGPEELSYGGDPRKVVLLVFSPVCRFCDMNMPTWQKLIKNIDGSSYRVVALSLKPEGVKEYVEKNQLGSVSVMLKPDSKELAKYKPSLTPLTVLIGPDGRVEKVWSGVISEKSQTELWQSLGINLVVANNPLE